MLAENAGALAQRGRRPVPYFALPDRKLERVRSESGRSASACDDGGETNAGSMDHGDPRCGRNICASRTVTPAAPAVNATG
jgi:hypothetical protein